MSALLSVLPFVVGGYLYYSRFELLYKHGMYSEPSRWAIDMIVPLLSASLTPLAIAQQSLRNPDAGSFLLGTVACGIICAVVIGISVSKSKLTSLATRRARFGLSPAHWVLATGEVCIFLCAAAAAFSSLK